MGIDYKTCCGQFKGIAKIFYFLSRMEVLQMQGTAAGMNSCTGHKIWYMMDLRKERNDMKELFSIPYDDYMIDHYGGA